ncbi:MAG: RES family NAD+ phosphorylase [Sphingobium sp.]
MRFQGRCYRGHDPAWSFTPLSGEGAAITGGRFNRKGEPVLYLSLDIMTAIGECTQGFSHRLQPLLMCEYEVDCEKVADLRDEAGRQSHGVLWDDLACGWLTCQRERRDAPSWLVTERLQSEGYVGLLVPSFVPGAMATNQNLILWQWGPDLPSRVVVFDPTGRLPANQLSWPEVKR